MKKFFAWLTKSSKIVRILTYIYRGLVVAQAAYKPAIDKLKELQPDLGVFDILDQIGEYIDVAAKAVKTVLDWLGANTEEIKAKALEAAENKNKDGICACAAAKVGLSDITDKLKEELK